MHQSLFYQVSAGVFVFFLVSAARASVARRGPPRSTALVYAAFTHVHAAGCCRCFRASRCSGPIYVPGRSLHAAGLSAAAGRAGDGDRPGDAIASRRAAGVTGGSPPRIAVVFVATFLAVQWPFADFLVSPWARNDFFGSHRMDYGVHAADPGALVSAQPARQPRRRPADRGGARVRLGAARPVVGQLDVAGAAMIAPRDESRDARWPSCCPVRWRRWRMSAAPTRSLPARPVPTTCASACGCPASFPAARRSRSAWPAPRAPADYRVARPRGAMERRLQGRAAPRDLPRPCPAIRRCMPPSSGS